MDLKNVGDGAVRVTVTANDGKETEYVFASKAKVAVKNAHLGEVLTKGAPNLDPVV